MEALNFDTGVKEYRLGRGVLRFNPSDPNLYARFLDALEQVSHLEQELSSQAKDAHGPEVIRLLARADSQIKTLLGQVFEADFSSLLGGVNLLSCGSNGRRLIVNLFEALEPILTQGARDCARAEAQKL